MNDKVYPNPFGRQNKLSSVLVTFAISSLSVCLVYIIYRQICRFLEGLNVANPRNDTIAPTVDLNQKPVLWDVYIEGGESGGEWHRLKPLSTAVLETMPTIPSTPDRREGLPTAGEETLCVGAIVVLPSRTKQEPGCIDREEVGDWVIGTTTLRCRRIAPSA